MEESIKKSPRFMFNMLDAGSEVEDDIEDRIESYLESIGVFKSVPEDVLGDYWDEQRRKTYDSANKKTGSTLSSSPFLLISPQTNS